MKTVLEFEEISKIFNLDKTASKRVFEVVESESVVKTFENEEDGENCMNFIYEKYWMNSGKNFYMFYKNFKEI